jgi:hypothetical protein
VQHPLSCRFHGVFVSRCSTPAPDFVLFLLSVWRGWLAPSGFVGVVVFACCGGPPDPAHKGAGLVYGGLPSQHVAVACFLTKVGPHVVLVTRRFCAVSHVWRCERVVARQELEITVCTHEMTGKMGGSVVGVGFHVSNKDLLRLLADCHEHNSLWM